MIMCIRTYVSLHYYTNATTQDGGLVKKSCRCFRVKIIGVTELAPSKTIKNIGQYIDTISD